jgi:hypothetical protein
VATKSLVTRGGQTYVPIGGIAHAGAKGISKVEIQIDNAPWEAAELREPLSELTWVIWRYDWPFSEGGDTPIGGPRVRRTRAASGDRGDRLPYRLRSHRFVHRGADYPPDSALSSSIVCQ